MSDDVKKLARLAKDQLIKQLAEKYNKPVDLCDRAFGIKMIEIDLDYLEKLEKEEQEQEEKEMNLCFSLGDCDFSINVGGIDPKIWPKKYELNSLFHPGKVQFAYRSYTGKTKTKKLKWIENPTWFQAYEQMELIFKKRRNIDHTFVDGMTEIEDGVFLIDFGS